MAYNTVTIQKLNEIPVTGFAAKVQAVQQTGNLYVPTFFKTLVMPKNNVYQITITDPKLRVAGGGDADLSLDPYTTDVEIKINDIVYKNCKKIGGTLQSSKIVDGYTVFLGTVKYKGYIWRRPDGSENTGEL